MMGDKQKNIADEDKERDDFAKEVKNNDKVTTPKEEGKAETYKHILLDLGFQKKKNGDDKEQYVKKEGELIIGRTFSEKFPKGKFWAIQNDNFLQEVGVKKLKTVQAFYDVREAKKQSTLDGHREELAEGPILTSAVEPVSPNTIINEAQEMATALYNVVEKQHLYMDIGGKKYLQLEAWQLLGKFCRVYGVIESVRSIEYFGVNGFEARAVVMDNAGKKIAEADAACMMDEPNWMGKPLFQLMSMAQTRALSKAYRSCLSFIVSMAGYSPTPLEEMQDGRD